jgi:hypothetical protein
MSSFSVFDNNPFVDGLMDYLTSPEGILREQVRDLTWEMLSDVQLDAANRLLLWGSEGGALTTEQSAQRINQSVVPGQGITTELIEEEIYGWLEMGYVPENYSEQQIEQLEQTVAAWVADFEKPRPLQSA